MSVAYFDDILIILGTGKWNYLYFFGASSCTFWIPAIVIASTFVTPKTDFQCNPGPSNDTIIEIQKCSYFSMQNTTGNGTLEHKCDRWIFNQTNSSSTITSEFNLVCDRAYLRPLYQTAYMIGNIVGSPINGVLSDKFGRKTIVILTTVLGTTSVFVSFFVNDVIWILLMRIITGFSLHSLMLSSFTLSMEVCEPKLRSIYGILYTLPWAFGTMWWGCLGYLIRDWRWLQAVSLLPILVLAVCLCFYDESPRWLIVNDRHDDALKFLKKAASWNGRALPPDAELVEGMKCIKKTALVNKEHSNDSGNPSYQNFVLRQIKKALNLLIILFKTFELRRITLLMYFTFFVSGLVFYGMALNAVNFNLNSYVYIVVVGCTEIPAYLLTGFLIEKFGRTFPTVVAFVVSGVTILILAFVPAEPKWVIFSLVFIGNSSIAAAFQIVFLLGTEIFPTEVRSQGFGTSSFLSSVGGGVASFITDLLGSFYPWLPAIFFGSLATAAGIASIYIPETLNKNLPDTIKELELNAVKKRESRRNDTN